MRDNKRIERILFKLGLLWMKHPDERFYQLLINNGFIEDKPSTWRIEDNIVEKALDKILKEEK